jgi:N utilization substance protein B
MSRRSRARELVVQLLFMREFNTQITREAIEAFVRQNLRDGALVTFCLSLYDGVVAHLEEIDQRLSVLAENWRLPRMAAVDRNVLRLGAFELLHTPDTPASVIIDEAIELARRFGSANSPSFVNGILDRVREPNTSGDTQG